MLYFMIGCMLALLSIAVYLCSLGVPLWAAATIFIFPILIFADYFYLQNKVAKQRESRNAEIKAAETKHQLSLDIVNSIPSNDNSNFGPNFFKELDQMLEDQGLVLHTNLSGCVSPKI